MSEWNYIIGAYALTWIGLLGYALYLHGRVRQAARRLDRVRNEGDTP